MRKNLKFMAPIFAILVIGMLGIACGGGDDYECTGPADCTGNDYCDMTTHTCKCNPDCTNACGGDDGCGGTCPDTCTGGQVCSGTPNYVCEDPGGCTNGAVQCSGTIIQTCTNEAWVNGLDCADDGELCINGECVAESTCTNGAVRCLGSVPQTCVSEAWVSGTDCADGGQICVAGACEDVPTTEECPTSLACTDLTEGDGFLGCTEGGAIPGTATACQPADGCNGNFVCAPTSETEAFCVGLCGTCPSGQTCDELIDGGASGCLDGVYIPEGAQTDCGETSPCVGNASCYIINDAGDTMCIENCSVSGPCNSGDVGCDGDVVQSCQAGVWVDGIDCSNTGETCYNGICASGDLCPTGQDCADVSGGKMGCLEGGGIPAGAETGCSENAPCDDQFTCWTTETDPVCIEDCGSCSGGLVCFNVLDGYWACTESDGNVSANAEVCAADYSCTNPNANCWIVGDQNLCIDVCSAPH